MKKVFLIILFSLNICLYPYQTWIKQTESLGSNFLKLKDGELLLTGTLGKSSENDDLAIMKMNANGEILFSKSAGGIKNDGGQFLIKSNNEGFFCVGFSNSFSEEKWGVWILKMDENLNIIWQKMYLSDKEAICYDIIGTTDGGLLAAFQNYEIGGPLYLLRIDETGNILWEKEITVSGSDFPESISEDMQGGFLISFIKPYSSVIIKIDDGGNIWWAKEMTSGQYFVVTKLFKEDDGVVFVGSSSEKKDCGQIAILKLDAHFNIIWKRGYNTKFSFLLPSYIVKGEDGGYLVSGVLDVAGSGQNDFDIFLLKTDAHCNVTWNKRFGGNLYDDMVCLDETDNDEILVLGYTEMSDNNYKGFVGQLNGYGSFDFICYYEKFIESMTTTDISVNINDFYDFSQSNYSFTLIDTDINLSDSAIFLTDLCSPSCPTIDISPSSLPSGRSGEAYSAVLTASGGSAPYKFSISSGNLPNGLSLSESGTISGTPSEGGDYNFTVSVVDASYCGGKRDYLLHIETQPPSISSVSKLSDPFRLKVTGSNFHSDLKVYIGGDENPWTNVKFKSSSQIVLKGGSALKAKFPKGVPVEIKIVNGDGGEATFTYKR